MAEHCFHDHILGTTVGTVALILLVGLAIMGTVTGTVAAQQSVTGCETIDSPGEYVLEGDVGGDVDSCIEITSDDVTFDGQGNSIVGVDDENSTGISVTTGFVALENVEVTNVTLVDWGQGVSFSFVNESEITDVEITDAEDTAISVFESSENLVADNKLSGNEQGISVGSFLSPSSNNTVANNTVKNTNGSAVSLVFNTRQNTVRDNRIQGSAETGIGLLLFPTNNTVTNNTVTGGGLGVLSALAADNEFSENEITDNVAGGGGVFSFGERLENNRIEDNQEAGILLLNSFGIEVVDNEVRENTRDFTNAFLPDAEEEAEGEFGSGFEFDANETDEIIEGEERNVVERMETGSQGAETVLSFESKNVSISGVKPSGVPASPGGQQETGLYFNATNSVDVEEIPEEVEEGELPAENLTNSFLDVDVHYDSADPDLSGVDESELALHRYDEDAGGWVEVSSNVDTQNETVSANVTKSGTFGVFTEGSGTGGGSPPSGERGHPSGVDTALINVIDGSGNGISPSEMSQAVGSFLQDGTVNGYGQVSPSQMSQLVGWFLTQ